MVCPCHLPLTLAALAAVLGGTAAGAVLHAHIVVAGVLISSVWLAGTARGVWLLRRPPVCPVPPARPAPAVAVAPAAAVAATTAVEASAEQARWEHTARR